MFTTELCPFDKTTFRIRYFYGEPGHNYRTSEVWRWHSQESLKLRMWIIARIAKITTAEPDSHMRIEDLLGPRLSRALVKQLKFSHGTWSYNIYQLPDAVKRLHAFSELETESGALAFILGTLHHIIYKYLITMFTLLLILHVFSFHFSNKISVQETV